MNGNPFTTNFIGSTGQYPIYDYIKTTSNVLISKIAETSNALHYEILATSNITSNICYAISSNVGLLFKSEFGYFMNKDSNNEIYFNNKQKTKINNNGEIFVYHSADNTLPNRAPGFWNVENELTSLIRESIGARFDIVNLQVDTLDIHTLIAQNTASILSIQGVDASQNITIAGLEAQITSTNAVVSTKQDALTFVNPFLNTANTISLKYDNTLTLDGNNKLRVYNPSFWVLSNSNMYYNSGNVGIGINNPNYNLDIINTINASNYYRSGVLQFIGTEIQNSNLSRLQGFINSNVLTPQTIPKIATTEVNLKLTTPTLATKMDINNGAITGTSDISQQFRVVSSATDANTANNAIAFFGNSALTNGIGIYENGISTYGNALSLPLTIKTKNNSDTIYFKTGTASILELYSAYADFRKQIVVQNAITIQNSTTNEPLLCFLPNSSYYGSSSLHDYIITVKNNSLVFTNKNISSPDKDLFTIYSNSDMQMIGKVGIGIKPSTFPLDVVGNINADYYYRSGVLQFMGTEIQHSNLSRSQGFINSNVLSTQTVPQIYTNKIGVGILPSTFPLDVVGNINADYYYRSGVLQFMGTEIQHSNLSRLQGFINSNVLSTQTVPQIYTNKIGIGITPSTFPLDVVGNINADYYYRSGVLQFMGTEIQHSNLSRSQGFINSNVLSIQTVPKIYTNSIGIGTSSPQYLLDITNGTMINTTLNAPILRIGTNATNAIDNTNNTVIASFMNLDNATGVGICQNGITTIGNNANQDFILQAKGTTANINLRTNNTNTVAIAPTLTTIQNAVEINGNLANLKIRDLTSKTPALEFSSNSGAYGSTANYDYKIINNNNGLNINKKNTTAEINLLSINSSGNIGIGATNAANLLQIKGGTYVNALMSIDSTNPPRGIGQVLLNIGYSSYTLATSGDYYGIGFGYNLFTSTDTHSCCEIGCLIQNSTGSESGDLVFSTRPGTSTLQIASERMRITSGGNIGIGTTTINATLDISGSTVFDGTTSLRLCNNASQYGRTQLYMIGRWEGGNDSWNLSAGRNEIIFGYQTSLNSAITYPNSIQSYAGSLGFFASGYSTTTPAYYIQNNGGSVFNGSIVVNGNGIYIKNGGNGYITLQPGNGGGNYCGYVEFYNSSGQRRGYMGYSDVNQQYLHLACESGCLGYWITGGNLSVDGTLQASFSSIGNSGTDYLGVQYNYPNTGVSSKQVIYAMYGTFTGFHRCFTNDDLFSDESEETINDFKFKYAGRVVVSTGKIATDLTNNDDNDENEWTIHYDKSGITLEDALPIVQLSRQRKDKKVFGVFGLPKRKNSRKERMIVNSVGEGGIWVVNTNGNIENGDYLQTSDELGYAEKQDDDLLHNYTIGKATIDCNFELNSDKYETITLDNGVKASFIACTYHCG